MVNPEKRNVVQQAQAPSTSEIELTNLADRDHPMGVAGASAEKQTTAEASDHSTAGAGAEGVAGAGAETH